MRIVSAKFFRLIAYKVQTQKNTEMLIKDLIYPEQILRKYPALIHELYDKIAEQAQEGKENLQLDSTHVFWQTPEVHRFFEMRGFQVQKHVISWAECNNVSKCQSKNLRYLQ